MPPDCYQILISKLKVKVLHGLKVLVHTKMLNPFHPQSNTFQCILATDGTASYVLLLYNSTTFSSSNGSFAISRFIGDITSYDLPGSGTAVVSSLSSKSNVAIPGLWVYRVDGSTILSGGGCG